MKVIIVEANKIINDNLLSSLCKLKITFLIMSGNLFVSKIIDDKLFKNVKELILKYHENDKISILDVSFNETLESIVERYVANEMKLKLEEI